MEEREIKLIFPSGEEQVVQAPQSFANLSALAIRGSSSESVQIYHEGI
jgi:hypothetical protein